VQNLAIPHKSADLSAITGRRFPLAFALSVVSLAVLWFMLCRELSGEWSVNEQYNFGWFVPFFAVYLFWLRWQDAPPAQIPNFKSQTSNSTALAIAIAALVLLLPVRLFEIANPEWRLVAWVHAATVVVLTLLLIWCAGGKPWLRHFAFPVAFIFVAVPWPTSVEVPIIQGLMRMVAHVAAETAMLLGIPAQVQGNLIRVTNGLVGVNEACSGIRSLQTSLMIGLLFGELKRFPVLRRVVLVAGAVVIALFANFVRAVFLVVVAATKSISEVSRWHDVAGYTIIALVFVGMMVLPYLLGKSGSRNPKSESIRHRSRSAIGNRQSAIPAAYLAAALCWLLFVEVGATAWYRLHEANLVSGIRWTVQWPEQAPNFRKLKIDEEVRAVLRFDEGQAAAWTTIPAAPPGDSGEASALGIQANRPASNMVSCLLYAFRWKPGRNSALLANLHRPDICLPASGWTQVADDGVQNYPISASFELPFRHFEFTRVFEGLPPQTAHAFYCLSEDRSSAPSAPRQGDNLPSMFGSPSEWTRAERLRAVLEGRRHLGQQVIEAIFVSTEALSAAEAESHLHDLVRDVVVLHENTKSVQ
jgi:exosortase